MTDEQGSRQGRPAMPGDAVFGGKVAVVTGAGAGFGAAFSRELRKRGTLVALLDINLPAAESVAAECPGAFALHCDVADGASVAAAFTAIGERAGAVDILINNAGLHSAAYNKGFLELGMEENRRLFEVNVMGIVQCTAAARPLMQGRPGASVLNIASIASWACRSAYGVSKLAVRGLTLSLAQELAADGIRVNGIAPGVIATDQIRNDFPEDFFARYRDELQLVHRTGEVEDIVKAMIYLCGPDGSFISGETLRVSGGHPISL